MTDERGDSPEETDRVVDRPGCRLTRWGCLAISVSVLVALLAAYRFAIWMGFSFSASV